jgi:hypothetical protein
MTKRLIITVALSFLGTFISMWIRPVWTNSVLSNFTFSEYHGLNTLMMAIWLPTIIVFMIIGAVLKFLLRNTENYVWPFSLGGSSALIWLYLRTTIFVKEPSFVDVLWAYSELAMPIVGCVLGWLICKTANKSFSSDALTRAG